MATNEITFHLIGNEFATGSNILLFLKLKTKIYNPISYFTQFGDINKLYSFYFFPFVLKFKQLENTTSTCNRFEKINLYKE